MLYEILVMCMLHVDPRVDRALCVDQMVTCTTKSSFNICSEYWEPLYFNNKDVSTKIAVDFESEI